MANQDSPHVKRLASAMRFSRLSLQEIKAIQKIFRIMDVKERFVTDYEDLAEYLLGWSFGEIRALERAKSPTEEILRVWASGGGSCSGSRPNAIRADALSHLLDATEILKRHDVYSELEEMVVTHCMNMQRTAVILTKSPTLPAASAPPDPELTTEGNITANESGFFEDFTDDSLLSITGTSDTDSDPVPDDEASCDTIMKRILETLDTYVSPRHEDALWFYCTLLVLALMGVVTSVRRLVRSAYSRPLDYSSVSLAFLALSRGKEAAFYLMAGGGVILLNEYALVDMLLMLLLVLMIFENKVVSPQVDVMRICYIKLQEQPKAPPDGREKVQRLHRRIRKQLVVFLSAEILVTLMVWYLDRTHCDHNKERARFSIHAIVLFLCVSEIVFTCVIFMRHYAKADASILKGRFMTPPRV